MHVLHVHTVQQMSVHVAYVFPGGRCKEKISSLVIPRSAPRTCKGKIQSCSMIIIIIATAGHTGIQYSKHNVDTPQWCLDRGHCLF